DIPQPVHKAEALPWFGGELQRTLQVANGFVVGEHPGRGLAGQRRVLPLFRCFAGPTPMICQCGRWRARLLQRSPGALAAALAAGAASLHLYVSVHLVM